jgi:hypothetical protein
MSSFNVLTYLSMIPICSRYLYASLVSSLISLSSQIFLIGALENSLSPVKPIGRHKARSGGLGTFSRGAALSDDEMSSDDYPEGADRGGGVGMSIFSISTPHLHMTQTGHSYHSMLILFLVISFRGSKSATPWS